MTGFLGVDFGPETSSATAGVKLTASIDAAKIDFKNVTFMALLK
jgi:hypothetical protein